VASSQFLILNPEFGSLGFSRERLQLANMHIPCVQGPWGGGSAYISIQASIAFEKLGLIQHSKTRRVIPSDSDDSNSTSNTDKEIPENVGER
jgi:hypothetical protein